MERKTYQLREEKLLEHIEKYEGNEIVRNALRGESGFTRQVEDFFDMPFSRKENLRGLEIYNFNFDGYNRDKFGKIPQDLIEILKPFSRQEIKIDKLKYEHVRGDYERWNTPRQKLNNLLVPLSMVAVAAGTSVAIASLYIADTQNVPLAIGGGMLGVIGLLGFLKFNRGPMFTENQLGEFYNLHGAARNADSFIRERYRAHFISRSFKKEL